MLYLWNASLYHKGVQLLAVTLGSRSSKEQGHVL